MSTNPTTSRDNSIPPKREWSTHHIEISHIWIPIGKPTNQGQWYLDVIQQSEPDTMDYNSLSNIRGLSETDFRLLEQGTTKGTTKDCWI